MSPARANGTGAGRTIGSKKSKTLPAPNTLPARETAASSAQQNDTNVRNSSPAGSQDTGSLSDFTNQLRSAEKKSKKTERDVKTFRKEIEETEKRVVAEIDEEKKRLATERTSFDNTVYKLIQDALALPDLEKIGTGQQLSKRLCYTDIKLHPVYKQAMMYHSAANTILHKIEKLVHMESSSSTGTSDAGDKFKASMQSAKRAIAGARTMTKEDVDALMANKFNEAMNSSQLNEQEKEEACGLLAMGQEKTAEGVEAGKGRANTIGWDERSQLMQSAVAKMEWAARDVE